MVSKEEFVIISLMRACKAFSKSSSVNQNGRNGAAFQNKKKKDSENPQPETQENSDKYRLKEDYLGQHIDITR